MVVGISSFIVGMGQESLNQFVNNETINANAILKSGALSMVSSSMSYFASLPLGDFTDDIGTLVGYNLGTSILTFAGNLLLNSSEYCNATKNSIKKYYAIG